MIAKIVLTLLKRNYREQYYSNKIIESALVSEKSSLVGQNANTYVFKVNTSATKNQVKKAIEAKFDVNVTKVNILNVKGKTKRMMNLRGED